MDRWWGSLDGSGTPAARSLGRRLNDHRERRGQQPRALVWNDTVLDRILVEPEDYTGRTRGGHLTPFRRLNTGVVGDWLDKLRKYAKGNLRVQVEPVVEGFPVRLVYRNRCLESVVSRGNGLSGEHVPTLGLPVSPGDELGPDTHWWPDYMELDCMLHGHVDPEAGAAGARRLACERVREGRDMAIVLHDVHSDVGVFTGSAALVRVAQAIGIRAVPQAELLISHKDGLANAVGRLRSLVDGLPVEDFVLKVDNLLMREKLGASRASPWWALRVNGNELQAT